MRHGWLALAETTPRDCDREEKRIANIVSRRKFQSKLRTFLVVMIVFAALLGGITYLLQKPAREPAWRYDGQFHKLIEGVDRLEVECIDSRAHFEVSDPAEVKEVIERFCFSRDQYGGETCACSHVRIEWYRGREVVATVHLAHVGTVRWEKFPGRWALLTNESTVWVFQWLQGHGFAAHHIR
jgi:hypothetical protein